jgi:membrane protein YqaA with SNARE-associated domain
MIESFSDLHTLMSAPQWGMGGLLLICFLSATLLPLSSEPVLVAYLALYPENFWLAIVLAGIGNTIGGAFNYWLGLKSLKVLEKSKRSPFMMERQIKIALKLQQSGPKLLLLSWVPMVGDPMCFVAGLLELPLKKCLTYMALGKFSRYLVLCTGFISIAPYLNDLLKI